jgi:hypothetical protein
MHRAPSKGIRDTRSKPLVHLYVLRRSGERGMFAASRPDICGIAAEDKSSVGKRLSSAEILYRGRDAHFWAPPAQILVVAGRRISQSVCSRGS